jgi:hypothetical protein
MKSGKYLFHLLSTGLALFALANLKAQTLSQWTFEGLSTSGVNASPSPASGAGVASTLGMTFSGSSENSGIAPLAGTDGTNNGSSNLTWKVRGGGTNKNGWNDGAAIATQGAQFAASTVGYSGIKASFDWYPSTKGEASLLAQYTSNGTTWINVPLADLVIPPSATLSLVTNSSSSNSALGTYIKTTAGNTWYNNITLDLSGIPAVNNDASFAFRLVNASTGTDVAQASGGALDNTAGNWSFDNVKITGTVIPEPGTYALLLGLLVTPALLLRRRLLSA